MRISFLGTGTSHGVPVVACSCPVCRSADPRDRRYRSSVLIEDEPGDAGAGAKSGAGGTGGADATRGDGDGSGPTVVLVDAGPEFRLQALRAGILRLDALLLTHAHADHLHGLDDVRPLSRAAPLRVYGDRAALAETRERFSYAFREGQKGGGKPKLELLEAPAAGFELGGLTILPVPLLHGALPVLGWRVGSFAYLTDCSAIPETSLPLLEGVEVAALDGLRYRPHPTHFSVDEAIAAARRLGLRETWLTHLTHDAGHAELEAYCAARGADVSARPAWDGLVLDLP